MKTLFIFSAAPLSSNHSGAASRYRQNFLQLQKLSNEMRVIRFGKAAEIEESIAFENRHADAKSAKQMANVWHDIPFKQPRNPHKIKKILQSLFAPIAYTFPHAPQIARHIEENIRQTQPDLIWVEHAEAAAGMALIPRPPRWIYSHHDLLYRVRGIRRQNHNARETWELNACRRAETQIIRSAPMIITASQTEAGRISKLGGKNIRVIPVSYEAIAPPPESARVESPTRIIHFGSLETTANRVGLEAYLKRAHKQVVQACQQNGVDVSLWIIGDASKAKEPLITLLKEANAALAGFIPDLSAALRPYDIAILPYEQDTGYRTKLPLLLGHAQIVVATRAAIAGTPLPGLNEVCLICEQLDDFPKAISQITSQKSKMENIGKLAHKFFMEHFTPGAFENDYLQLKNNHAPHSD